MSSLSLPVRARVLSPDLIVDVAGVREEDGNTTSTAIEAHSMDTI